MWTFVDTDGVEPTNNHAEREIRAFVLYGESVPSAPKALAGMSSPRNLMTVAHCARSA